MRRAAEMLAASDAPIATVAARLGYTHTSNFSGAFRARHGVSPRQYRQSHQGPRTRKAQDERSE
jgi:AraC-like DNA-binding protein